LGLEARERGERKGEDLGEMEEGKVNATETTGRDAGHYKCDWGETGTTDMTTIHLKMEG